MVAKVLIAALVATLVALALPAARHLRETPPPPSPLLRLTFTPGPGLELGSGDEPLDAAVSPDGRRVAFVATADGIARLWLRDLETETSEALPGTEGGRHPSWSPAGDAIAFAAGERLRTIALPGTTVSDRAALPAPAGTAWLADGSLLVASTGAEPIRRLRDGTLIPATTLRPGERAHLFPSAAGAGFVYMAVGDGGRRAIRLVQGEQDRELTTTTGHGQIAGRYLLTVRDDVLLAQRFEPDTGTVQGRAAPLTLGVGVTADGRSLVAAGPRLVLAAAVRPRAREMAWFAFDGTRTGTLGEAGDLWQVRLSPDDRFVAVTAVTPLIRTLDVVRVPVTRGTGAVQLTRSLAADSDPVWSSDGQRIVFRSLQRGRPALFIRPAFDEDAEDELVPDTADATPTDWRGSRLLFQATDASGGQDLWSAEPTGAARREAARTGFNDTAGRWSPDGRWLAHVSDEPGRPDVYVSPQPPDGRVRVSFAGGTRPRWSRDGRSLFFLRGSTIYRASRPDGASRAFDAAVPVVDLPGIRDFDVAHRTDRILALVPSGSTEPPAAAALVDWQSSPSLRR